MARPPIRNLTKAQREVLALEWSQRRGYPIPRRPGGPWMILLILLGLMAGAIPGLLLLVWLALRHRDFLNKKNELVMRWADWYSRRDYY